MENFFRKILKIIILYIHIFTCTPCILIFYSFTLFGVFGEKSKESSFCFAIFITSIVLNIFLILLFNLPFTKQKCINLVGFDFYEKYLSHSTVPSKSLTRILGPTSLAFLYQGTTGYLRDEAHKKSIESLRGDIKGQYLSGNKKMGDETANLIGSIQKHYDYGGNITQNLKLLRNAEVKESAMKTASSIGKSVFGGKNT